jgi:hypothetical protein
MIPHLTFITDRLPPGTGGSANGFVIRIRPKYAQDAGIKAHELEHVRQWWVTLGLHSLLYLFFKRYRLWSEIRAYRVQLSFEADPQRKAYKRELFRKWIAEEYKLNMRPEEVDL